MATGDNLVLGKKDQISNHEMSVTRKDASSQQQTSVLWLYASDKNSTALRADGTGNGAGVRAYCPSGRGVSAFSDFGTAVYGESYKGGIGVVGIGTPAKKGEKGEVDTFGVIGKGTNAGVWGSSEGYGVYGTGSGTGTGVYGTSENGWGVDGETGPGVNAIGVYGFSPQGSGVYGQSQSGNAGVFDGSVVITGDLDVQGQKSAAVPFPDGTLRRLYSVESPESWFEDFGEARLVNGRAKVRVDPGFAAVIRGSYHVFVTPCGDSNGLYVTNKTSKSFAVREQLRGKSSLVFSYRIVAKRKDISGRRLAKVKPPPRVKKQRRRGLTANVRRIPLV